MRLNAAFLVGCIFLLSACTPLKPEPGMSFKDFNSKSAINMRGYLLPAGVYKDYGVARYETRRQKRQRERGEAQPANGWVFYYEKDGVMISETELLAMQTQQKGKSQEVASQPRKNRIKVNEQESHERNNQNFNKKNQQDNFSHFKLCKPEFMTIIDKYGRSRRVEIPNDPTIEIMVSEQILHAKYVSQNINSKVPFNYASFVKAFKQNTADIRFDVLRYYINNGFRVFYLEIYLSRELDYAPLMIDESTPWNSAAGKTQKSYKCYF